MECRNHADSLPAEDVEEKAESIDRHPPLGGPRSNTTPPPPRLDAATAIDELVAERVSLKDALRAVRLRQGRRPGPTAKGAGNGGSSDCGDSFPSVQSVLLWRQFSLHVLTFILSILEISPRGSLFNVFPCDLTAADEQDEEASFIVKGPLALRKEHSQTCHGPSPFLKPENQATALD